MSNLQAFCVNCHALKTRHQRKNIQQSRSKRLIQSSEESRQQENNKFFSEIDALEFSPLKLLEKMNQQQISAVVVPDGPTRVTAGPGTGKTRVLTARIAYLVRVKQVRPSCILALTFTNKAARELRERITSLIGPHEAEQVTMGTFHSLCLAILRSDIQHLSDTGYRRGFAVYDEYYSLKLIRTILKELEVDTEELTAVAIQAIISASKNQFLTADEFSRTPPSARLTAGHIALCSRVFSEYEKRMKASNTIDYDDMLTLTVKLFDTSERTRLKYGRHWLYIQVDEFQVFNFHISSTFFFISLFHGRIPTLFSIDYCFCLLKITAISSLSATLIRHRITFIAVMFESIHNSVYKIFVRNHALQAIYGWRGADVRNQERLDSEFSINALSRSMPPASLPPGAFASLSALLATLNSKILPVAEFENAGRVLELSLNYRSRQEILDVAFALLAPVYSKSGGYQLRLKSGLLDQNPFLKLPPPVQIVACADAEQEAEYMVDSLLQLLNTHEQTPSIAILYRTNLQSIILERLLVREGVSYTLAAQRSFYQRKEIRDVIAYLRLLRSNDSLALERIINEPPRGIGAKTFEKLSSEAQAVGLSLWEKIIIVSGESAEASSSIHVNMSKIARASIRRFYQLIERYRGYVQTASDLRACAASQSAPKINGIEQVEARKSAPESEEDIGEFNKVNLRIASAEIRRKGFLN